MKFLPFVPSTLLSIAILLLAGCASPTPYQPIGTSSEDGYYTNKLSGGRYHILFRGNESTSQERAYELALLRSAEITLESGYTRFVIIKINNNTRLSTRYQSGRSASLTKKEVAYSAPGKTGTTEVPRYGGSQGQYTKEQIPAVEITIEMLDENTVVEDSEAQYMHEAQKTADSLRKKYQLPAEGR